MNKLKRLNSFKQAQDTLLKTQDELIQDVKDINSQLRVLLNRKSEIIKNEKMINNAVPMSKYKYSRLFLKAITNVFPQIDTASQLNTALYMVRGLDVTKTASDLNLCESAVRARRSIVLKKTKQPTFEKFLAYFVENSKGYL